MFIFLGGLKYMNIQECDILNSIFTTSNITQRSLAESSGHSLGIVNRSIKNLIANGYLTSSMEPTDQARTLYGQSIPQSAVILAAGFGMRMVPINTETPKGLLEIHGEALIERIIRQLHEVNIHKIYVVVGFMKEQYEYLIDEYDVTLIVNTDYASKNNLHSLRLASEHLANAYVIPCDIWCRYNPFCTHEFYSWYMVSDAQSKDSSVRVNRKMELASVSKSSTGNTMIGISYITEKDAAHVRDRLVALDSDGRYDGAFWEESLYDHDRMIIPARIIGNADAVEINTYEQLRELDEHSNHLQSDILQIAADALNGNQEDICNITVLKKGMTNRSFLFDYQGIKHIMRIPGEGTDQLINRRNEAAVYQTIQDKHICDDIEYINPENGYKLTRFLDNARVCDPLSTEDITKCMKKLRSFHDLKLKVNHRFDLFGQIDFYETLWEGKASVYRDYQKTKAEVFALKNYIDKYAADEVLTHIDAVPDNFLFCTDSSGNEDIRLIDWEYAGMQDPHVDIAMFSIYAFYTREQIDQLIDIYFNGNCPDTTRIKIYCYVAVAGLLWSNWCEYKRNLGVDFGEYSLKQYRYAKEYSRLAKKECIDRNLL
jgi:CTP:phosphocholine cytidylyltransferase-like protein/thiamine kinase-like enzyme